MVVLLEGSPISTDKLWSSVRVTIGFLVTSLTKALLPRLLSLAGKSLGGSKAFPFKNGGHCVLGDLQCCRHFLVPFSKYVPCTGGLQSSCRNIKDDQSKQNAPEYNFEYHSKGSEYLRYFCILFLIHLIKILKTCFRFVIIGYCV